MTRAAITEIAAVGDGTLAEALIRLPEGVRTRAMRAERVSQLALAAAVQALAGADRLVLDGGPRATWGVALGTAFGCFLTNAAYQRRLTVDGVRTASPRLFAATVSNAAAGEVTIACRLGGPAITLSAGGASGLVALGHAADLITDGRADLVVAGGVDAGGDDLGRWLADGGLGHHAPPMREGAGMLVLEGTPERAPIGWIEGHALGFSARGEVDHAAALVARALDDAGASGKDVERVAVVGARAATPLVIRALRDAWPTARVAPPSGGQEGFAAAGPCALGETLAATPPGRVSVVLQLCASGHAAALVVAKGNP